MTETICFNYCGFVAMQNKFIKWNDEHIFEKSMIDDYFFSIDDEDYTYLEENLCKKHREYVLKNGTKVMWRINIADVNDSVYKDLIDVDDDSTYIPVIEYSITNAETYIEGLICDVGNEGISLENFSDVFFECMDEDFSEKEFVAMLKLYIRDLIGCIWEDSSLGQEVQKYMKTRNELKILQEMLTN